MLPILFVNAQPQIGTSTVPGQTQITITAAPSAGRQVLAFLFQFTENLTYSGGAAESISALIHDVQIVADDGTTSSIDGQCLTLSSLDAQRRVPQLSYQALVDADIAATTVTAVGQYAVAGPFRGGSFKIVFNINAATSTGLTGVSVANYTLTCAVAELDFTTVYTASKNVAGKTVVSGHTQPNHTYRLLGTYVANSTYTGKVPVHSAIIATDNAELSTVVTAIKVGGNTFGSQQCLIAEDAFNASIPDGVAVAGPFTGAATKGPVNAQTDNELGAAEFGGPTASITEVSLNTSETMLILERALA